MRILFIVQGEGRGHMTQAISLRQKLLREGHEVVGVLVGKSPARRLPSFFVEKMGGKIESFESPNFLPTPKNKQAKLLRSISYNMLRIHKYIRSILFIRRTIKETEADVVVNFYELLSGLTYAFCRPEAQMVCIAHQYIFLHPDFQFPQESKIELFSLKLFTRLTAIGSTKKLALSFRRLRDLSQQRLFIVPPLLREEVLQLQPQKGNYILGYAVNNGFAEEIKEWHQSHRHTSVRFFWDNKQADQKTEIHPNLSFHQLDDRLFLHYMAGARAYATTAGFESVCEAMYLGKPVLMVPTHIEQVCNAHDAFLAGAGVSSSRFSLDRLATLSDTHQTDNRFKQWVDQADWLITREFRADILEDDDAITFLQRIVMTWINRLIKYLPV